MRFINTSWLLLILLYVASIYPHVSNAVNRDFRIDYTNNQFLKDGEPFRFVGGSFHYFRALPETWQQKLRTMRAAGLNAVTTYIEWSLHNPKPNVFNWDGIANIERFIIEAAQEDLLVILRPGPYICAERDMGGFPYWLLTKYPDIKLRTYDTDYLREVRTWYDYLFSRLTKHLYGNGGPIIMVQVENEYGSYACDRNYSKWLRDETQRHVDDKAVLFTNDGPSQVPCGKIENVLATLDFGHGDQSSIDRNWRRLREYQPNGPLVNAEYYPGWLTHWHEQIAQVPTRPVVDSLRHMLDAGASVNFYMFYGGTNFGFTAGANNGGPGRYQPDLTSYDYDAPMDEAGDPTPKYMLIRDAIKDYLPLPNISVPIRALKMALPPLTLTPKLNLLSPNGRRLLGGTPSNSLTPLTFEKLDQYSGFVLYETTLPNYKTDPAIIEVPNLRDRAIVLVNNVFIGILSREHIASSIAISGGHSGETLSILVENQGRINFNVANDFKGIIGDVTLNKVPLQHWTITGFPLEDISVIEDLISRNDENDIDSTPSITLDNMNAGPTIFHATFNINAEKIYDTYVNTSGWGKGILYINGFNLGRYWPVAGPQITLYLPKELLRKQNNVLTLIELEKSAKNGQLSFSDLPIFT